MADLKVEGAELKKMVKLGKKKALSFGFCPGAKNEHTLLIDRRKGPEMLGKLARQEGGNPKVAFGTFEVKGRTMEMTCGRTVPQMAKVLKKYLKSQKTLMNVVILDADGNMLDSDVEDLKPDPTLDDVGDGQNEVQEDATAQSPEATDADADQPAAAPDAAALAARLKAVQPAISAAAEPAAMKLKQVSAAAVGQIKAAALEAADKSITALEAAVAKLGAAQSPIANNDADFKALVARATALKAAIADIASPAKDKLTTALGSAVQQIKERNAEAADTLLTRIEAALNKANDASPPPASADSSKWDVVLARLQPAVDKAVAEQRSDLAAINQAFSSAKEQADAGSYDKALAAAAKTAALLKQPATAENTSNAQDIAEPGADDIAPYVQSRQGWIETRNGLRKEIEELKSVIDQTTAGIDGLEDVSSKSNVLFDYLAEIDTNLEVTLEQLDNAPVGTDREGLKSNARQAIETYKGVLDTDFFKAVDNNGFVKTNIRGSALASLDKVSAALAS